MTNPKGPAISNVSSDEIDLEATVKKIVQRSNLKASLQPSDVRRAMSSYLEPEEATGKPWETWL